MCTYFIFTDGDSDDATVLDEQTIDTLAKRDVDVAFA